MNTPDITALTTCLRGSSVDTLRQLADRLEADAHGLWRLGVLLDTAEFCVKFRAVYVLAECLRAKLPLPGKIGGDFTKPTFGEWRAVLRDGSKALRSRTDTMIAVPDLLSNQSLDESIDALVDARNTRAHGATLTATQALAESGRIIEHVIGTARAFQTEKWDFLGEPLQVDVRNVTAPGVARWSRPYLRTRADGRMTWLFPWLVEKETSEGTVLLIFNRDNQTESKQGSLDYLDYGSGEERDLATECRGAVQDALKFFKLASYGPNWQSDVIERHRQFYVARESELEQLRNFVKSGTGQVQIVMGPPGFGKTALLAKLAEDCDTIRQFVSMTDDTTTDTKAILKHLRRQLDARTGSQDERTTHDADNKPERLSEVIVIDGLDEAKDLPGLLRRLRSDEALQHSRFVFGGQPHVLDHIKGAFGDDSVNELELTGLSLDQTKALAELHELRQLSPHDFDALHKSTQGGPLFLRTVFHDLSIGAISSSDLYSLPKSVEDYWESLLSRHNPTGVNQDPDADRHLKRIAADAFQTILSVWEKEPSERGKLSKAFGEEVDRRLQTEQTVFLGVLAQSPLPLSVLHLKQIVPTTDELFVQKTLNKLGSLIEVEGIGAKVKLCHGSLRSFLLSRYKEAMEKAKSLLRAWTRDWAADDSGVRARVFCSLCDRAERTTTLNDWDFLTLFLRAWGFDETTQLYESMVEGVPKSLGKQRLQDAFDPLPSSLVADMNATIAGETVANRGGGRVITRHDARRLELEQEREAQPSAESFASEDDENDDFEDDALLWHLHRQHDELEAKWKKGELPPEWFGDWTSCETALSGMRAAYRQALDGPPALEELPREERQGLVFAAFLRRCKRQLSAAQPDIPLIAYNSGVFRDTPLDLKLKEHITRTRPCWIEREHRHPASPFAESEALHREIGQNFVIAAGSTVICYVRPTSGASNATELVCEDWWDFSQPARVLVPHRIDQFIEALCLSHDGRVVLVKVSERGQKPGDWTSRLEMLDTAHGKLLREVQVDSGRKFKRLFDATPNLTFMLIDLDGQVALLNSITGALVKVPFLDKVDWAAFGRISRDGRVVVFRQSYGGYVGFDTVRTKTLLLEARSGGAKDTKFQIDPSGGLYLECGQLLSVAEGICVHDFDNSRDQDCAAFSLDSRILVIAAASVLRAYDVREREQIGEYPLREPCSSVTLSGDGSLALLKTQSDNLLVVDLLKSAVGLIDIPMSKDESVIPACPDDSASYFWNEENERIVKYWKEACEVLTQETNTSDFELSEWTPGSGEYQSPKPLFKAGEEIWFRCQQGFEFSILQLDERRIEKGVSLLGNSAPHGLSQAIQSNLRSLNEARKGVYSEEKRFPEPCLDSDPYPIDAKHVAIGIVPNILAIVDVVNRSITHWVSWGKPPSAALDLTELCAHAGAVYATTSNDELLIWLWGENRDLEVLKTTSNSGCFEKLMGVCGTDIVIQLFVRSGQGVVEIYDTKNRRVVEKPVDIRGFRWGSHFMPITDQPLFLVSLEPMSADLCRGNQLALVDVLAGRVVASISFESPIAQLFRLGGDVFGIAMEDGAIEALRICKNAEPR